MALTTHPPSSAEVKERVELYLYTPSVSSWPVLGRPLRLYTDCVLESGVVFENSLFTCFNWKSVRREDSLIV